MDLSELEGELANCQACPLRQDAIAPVGWYGNPESPIVFVGEGPGRGKAHAELRRLHV